MSTSINDGIPVAIQFNTLRNISSKYDIHMGRKVLIGLVSINEIVKLADSVSGKADKKANVRDYSDKSKKGEISIRSGVPARIYETLENEPGIFHLLNGGITLLCKRSHESKEKPNYLSINNPSIANGGHTFDVINKFQKEYPNSDAVVKVEVIYISDSLHNENLNDEISIARNRQTAVKELSIAGKRGVLHDLNFYNELGLQISETDKDKMDPIKVLQCTFLLTPDSLWKEWEKSTPARSSFYSSKASVLKRYTALWEEKTGSKKKQYDFTVKLSKIALKLYFQFQQSSIISGMLKQIQENSYTKLSNGKFKLRDGWILPIISALSYYIDPKTGEFNKPSDNELKGIIASIYNAGYAYEKNPQSLGKNPNSYRQPLKDLQNGADLNQEAKETFR